MSLLELQEILAYYITECYNCKNNYEYKYEDEEDICNDLSSYLASYINLALVYFNLRDTFLLEFADFSDPYQAENILEFAKGLKLNLIEDETPLVSGTPPRYFISKKKFIPPDQKDIGNILGFLCPFEDMFESPERKYIIEVVDTFTEVQIYAFICSKKNMKLALTKMCDIVSKFNRLKDYFQYEVIKNLNFIVKYGSILDDEMVPLFCNV